MKLVRMTAILLIALFGLSSCGLARSAVQLPVRTGKNVLRSVGF